MFHTFICSGSFLTHLQASCMGSRNKTRAQVRTSVREAVLSFFFGVCFARCTHPSTVHRHSTTSQQRAHHPLHCPRRSLHFGCIILRLSCAELSFLQNSLQKKQTCTAICTYALKCPRIILPLRLYSNTNCTR